MTMNNIKITKFEKLKNNKYKVVGDQELVLYDNTIIKFNLLQKKVIDNLDEVLEYDKATEVYYEIVKIIDRKLRTVHEVEKILKEKEVNNQYSEAIINKLKESRLLDDEKYVSSYIHDVLRLKNTGPRKIETDLLALGIKDYLVKEYLSNITDDIWEQRISKMIEKKLKSNHTKTGLNLKVSIATFIVHEGYTKEMVMKVANKYDYTCLEAIEKDYRKIFNKYKDKYEKDKLDEIIKNKMCMKGYTLDEIISYMNKE